MKKIVYLISPNTIDKYFYRKLDLVLSYGNSAFFSIEGKKPQKEKLKISQKRLKKITKKYKVKFILNDDYKFALKINADGCHMGQLDGPLKLQGISLKKNFGNYLSQFN